MAAQKSSLKSVSFSGREEREVFAKAEILSQFVDGRHIKDLHKFSALPQK